MSDRAEAILFGATSGAKRLRRGTCLSPLANAARPPASHARTSEEKIRAAWNTTGEHERDHFLIGAP